MTRWLRWAVLLLTTFVTAGVASVVPRGGPPLPGHSGWSTAGGDDLPPCVVYHWPGPTLVAVVAAVTLLGVFVGRHAPRPWRAPVPAPRAPTPFRTPAPAPAEPEAPAPVNVPAVWCALLLAALMVAFGRAFFGPIIISCTSCRYYSLVGVAPMVGGWVVALAARAHVRSA